MIPALAAVEKNIKSAVGRDSQGKSRKTGRKMRPVSG